MRRGFECIFIKPSRRNYLRKQNLKQKKHKSQSVSLRPHQNNRANFIKFSKHGDSKKKHRKKKQKYLFFSRDKNKKSNLQKKINKLNVIHSNSKTKQNKKHKKNR